MVKNYLKMALRSLKKEKSHSFINLFGLAIGMACCILILLFVNDELSYDSFHDNADRIYRLAAHAKIGGDWTHWAAVPFAAAPAFHQDVPEIASYVRIQTLGTQIQVTYENKKFEEPGVYLADSTFFEVFDHKFIQGDPATALRVPGSVVITEETAQRLFGDDDPMGKIITFAESGIESNTVTGVITDVPQNAHFTFNYIVSFTGLPPSERSFLNHWLRVSGWSYILVHDGADMTAVVGKFPEIMEKNTGEQARQVGIELDFFVEPLRDIYLNSDLRLQIGATGNINYVYTFSTIAIFILIIACINFMNLSTARSANRSKEVGLRKVFGAYKKQLVYQFLSESVVMAVSALILAVALVWLSLPLFNGLAQKNLVMNVLNQPVILSILVGLVLFTGIIAGSYPAFFLSAFKPIFALRGQANRGAGRFSFRKILVVLQFSVSITLIISTLIVLQQIEYMKNKSLGFAKEQLAVIELQTPESTRPKVETIKNEILRNPNVTNVSFSSSAPGITGESRLFIPEGASQNDTHLMALFRVDYDFLTTYQLTLLHGRDFSEELVSDTGQAFILNETAAQVFGWADGNAVGKDIEFVNNRKGKVIGIVQDFHYASMRDKIEPLIIIISPQALLASVRIRTDNVTDTIKFLEATWSTFEPGQEFTYSFIDENFTAMYRTEERLSDIFKTFAVLAIVIACLGLFGLASFTAEQKRKEIGIRKVLGASTDSIITKLSKDFTIWVVIANIVAWPVTYYVITTFWLSNFPYRIEISTLTFIIASIVSLLIALLTVSYQSITAALTNPVKSLRDE